MFALEYKNKSLGTEGGFLLWDFCSQAVVLISTGTEFYADWYYTHGMPQNGLYN